MARSTVRFAHLPLAVQIGTAFCFFLSWITFERLIIDRRGLWQYLPLYRVGNICVYDVAAITLICGCFIYAKASAGRAGLLSR